MQQAPRGGPLGALFGVALLGALVNLQVAGAGQHNYLGSHVGRLASRRGAQVSGDVFAVDEQTLLIRAFSFDGRAPDTYFWAGVAGPQPGADGFIVPDERGSTKPLESYAARDVVLRLPEGRTLREIRWLSVWSRQPGLSLADVALDGALQVPRPLELAPLGPAAPGLRSGPVTVVDAQTLLLADFHLEARGPAHFWLSRGGVAPGAAGVRLRDENGSLEPLRSYHGETLVLSLPDELTVHHFDFFGVWSAARAASLGHTRLPAGALVPPSPKMLGIRPEHKLNCEILYDELGFELRWVLDGDDIVMQLVAKIEPAEYMAFGLAKDDARSLMARADAVVAWVERQSGQVHAADYYLGARGPCPAAPAGPQAGSCPDTRLPGGGDSLTLLHGAIVNGYSMVTFKRPQLGVDELYDQHVYSDGRQAVVWAIGALNERQEAAAHRLRSGPDTFIDFARTPQWNCPVPDANATMGGRAPAAALGAAASHLDSAVVGRPAEAPPGAAAAAAAAHATAGAWFVPAVACPAERTFHAQIGPTGGRRAGGAAGRARWGVAWYINGLLAPELVVERNQTYRFVVEGGNDKAAQSRRHPLYLTDSAEGGLNFRTDEERQRERVFGGVALRAASGQLVPTAEGRLCEWKPTNLTLADPDLYPTFAAYQRSLRLDCLAGQPASLSFRPDQSTPELLYYQCYTNRFMGWRIRVVDSCAAYLSAGAPPDPSLAKLAKLAKPAGARAKIVRRRSSAHEPPGPQPSEPRLSFQAPPKPLESAPVGPFRAGSPLDRFEEQQFAGPAEVLVLNNSLLGQQPALNLSTIEQLLRLAPSDLELLDDQQLELVNALVLAAQQHRFSQQHLPHLIGSAESANKTSGGLTSRMVPKSLQSYVRRLASIYYPVQQQLVSMLAPAGFGQPAPNVSAAAGPAGPVALGQQGSARPAQAAGADPVPVAAGSSSSFSLASLVSKPKIDLSKSNISKKLSKLRLKSGRKPEDKASGKRPASGLGARPRPTPANEFNYDIFNNQLAQLEKQQKQLRALETMAAAAASWPLAAADLPFTRLNEPSQPATGAPSSPLKADDPVFLSSLIDDQAGPQHQQEPAFGAHSLISQSLTNNNINIDIDQHRLNAAQLGPPTQLGQQPFVVDYLSLGQDFAGRYNSSDAHHNFQPQHSPPPQIYSPNGQQQQQQPQQPGPAVFIKRLPPQPHHHYQQQLGDHRAQFNQQQQSTADAARQVSIRPYAPPDDRLRSQISYLDSTDYGQLAKELAGPRQQIGLVGGEQQPQDGLPSMQLPTMAIHGPGASENAVDAEETVTEEEERHQAQLNQQQPDVGGIQQPRQPLEPAESLSGSRSGSGSSYYAAIGARQQQGPPTHQATTGANANNNDMDHMLAIERFSKQSSERRPPSVVHPITGLEVHLYQQLHGSANQSHPQKVYSSMLINKPLMGPDHSYRLNSANEQRHSMFAETLDADQSVQATDLRRVNASEQQHPTVEIKYSTPLPPTTTMAQTSPTTIASSSYSSREITNANEQPPDQKQQQQRTPGHSDYSNGLNKTSQLLHNYFFGLSPPDGGSARATTESVPTVLIRPLNFDFFASDPPATATIISTTTQPTTASSSTTTSIGIDQVSQNFLSGPLIPFSGGQQATLATASSSGSQMDLASGSTLVASDAPASTSQSIVTQPDRTNYDPSPFVPMELANLHSFPSQQSRRDSFQNNNIPYGPFKTPSLIETMLGQYQNTIQPHPPVQLVSHLNRQLNSLFAANDRSSATRTLTNDNHSSNDGSGDTSTEASSNQMNKLRPDDSLSSLTYGLKPAYHKTTGDHFVPISTGGSESSVQRLVGHQFDHLSSLSSPPSTSIVLDPMQAASSSQMGAAATTIVGRIVNNPDKSINSIDLQQQQDGKNYSTVTATGSSSRGLDTNFTISTGNGKLQISHQRHIPGKLLPDLNLNNLINKKEEIREDSVRLKQGSDSVNNILKGNTTDNAILSHVMALISSNAIPTPPLVPVSGYSNADYFLPVNDRSRTILK